MAITNMVCPFSTKICSECAYYRGRHYYLSLCENYRGYIGSRGHSIQSNGHPKTIPDFETMGNLVEPWRMVKDPSDEKILPLRLIDMESGATKKHNYDEAESWDWENPFMIRTIDGRHITSWKQFREIVNHKAKKGAKVVDVYEGPRFILLGGG
jgi:hypothetical protein